MFDASSLRRLKLPALAALALLIAVSGYYLLLAIRRNTYLTTSNIRLLTTIGHQFDDWVRRQEEIFRIVIGSDDPAAMTREWKSSATWKFGKRPLPKDAPPLDLEPPTLVMDASGRLSLELDSRSGDERLDQRIVPFDAPLLEALQRDVFDIVLLAAPDGKILKQSGQADLYLTDLGSLVAPGDSVPRPGQTADVKDLAGKDYRLFLQPCCGRVRVRTADAGQTLPGKTEAVSGAERTPTAAPQTSKPGKAGTRDRGGAAATAGGTARTGLVVCGLVQTGTLAGRRFAVSFTTMLVLAGILLIIVVSWPFMKLALIGNRQRVRLVDVLLLGISGLLVLSISTLYLLDSYAYGRLKTHIDDGLEKFSEAIQSNMRKEIAAAYSQLRVLQSAALARYEHPDGEGRADSPFLSDVLQSHPDPDFSFYPFFESFTLIDSRGAQASKWSIRKRSQASPLIAVKDRDYLLRVKENRTWKLPRECVGRVRGEVCEGVWLPAIDRFALESIRSITRMNTQAVLAVPTDREDVPVAALSFPMISLVKPVVAPGFGFAVIEDGDSGRVLFHSDDRRNLIEQFFLETDMDKRLRSIVAARRAEHIDLRYWGQDYRAYVAPLKSFPWSLVTFYEKDRIRSVNVDSMVTTLLFLIPYMLGSVVICALILIWPQRRATWLWPHPRGLAAYLELSVFYILLIGVFGATIYQAGRNPGGRRGPDWLLILFAFAFPALAWLVTYLRLQAVRRATPIAGDEITDPTRDSGEKAWGGPVKLLSWFYMTAAAFLLIITAAMPTAAFFKLAHSIQIVPFIKNNQVKLVAALAERRQRAEKEAASLSSESRSRILSSRGGATVSVRRTAIGGEQLEFADGNGKKSPIPAVDIYYQPFDTKVSQTGGGAGAPDRTDSLPEFLESYLPSYSEFSVERRELMHDESADGSRFWNRAGDRIVLTSKDYGDGALEINSLVPTFGGLPALLRGRSLGLILIFGVILLLALAIARFVSRRVFLLDVPFWTSGSGGFAPPVQSVFVVCRREELKKAYLAGRRFETLDLAALLSPAAKQEDWDAALSGVEQTLSGEPVLLDRFEKGSSDGQLSAKKLWLVEELLLQRRRLVILSTVSPVPLQHGSPPAGPGSKAGEGPSAEQRWASLLTSSFMVIDLDPRFETDADEASRPPGRMTVLDQALGTGLRSWFRDFSGRLRVGQYRKVRLVLERECARNPYLSSIHDDLDRMIRRRGEEGLDREEILAEIEERASNYYEGLWACCSLVEKLALEHLAEDGFANYRDGKVVRRLIARGLVRRDPHLRLMNETFRRFVVSTVRRNEIASLEQDTQASAWDHFKRPFGTILALVLVLFAITQKERFDATMALIVGATGVLPSLLKLAGLVIGDKSPLPAKPN
jgi:hypothetical protein